MNRIGRIIRGWSVFGHLVIFLLSASPIAAKEIRLTDNSTISGMVEEVTAGPDPR